ncbi:hypothetical protein, partial [Actinacidiphila glaucinigra]
GVAFAGALATAAVVLSLSGLGAGTVGGPSCPPAPGARTTPEPERESELGAWRDRPVAVSPGWWGAR